MKGVSCGLLGVWHFVAIMPAPTRVLGGISTLIQHRTVPDLLLAKGLVRTRGGIRVAHDKVLRLGLLRRS